MLIIVGVVNNTILLIHVIIQIFVLLVLIIALHVQTLPTVINVMLIFPFYILISILINAFLVSKIRIAMLVKYVYLIVLNVFL